MAYIIILSICLLLIFQRPICATPVPQGDLESLYAPPPDPTWTPASETTLQPSPTSTIAPPEDLSDADDEPVANTALSRKFVDSRCTPAQQAIIENAWYEASLLDDASKKYVPNGAFSTAYINHFGANVASTGSWWPWDQNYRKIIGDNLNRRHALETDNAPSNAYLYYYCYDWRNNCPPGRVGYSNTNVGLWWYNHYITWCPLFFDERVPTLGKAISEVSNLPNSAEEKNILEPFYFTTAASMYHETWHMRYTISNPMIEDYNPGYWPEGSWVLAKTKGAYWTSLNADSYVCSNLAIYIWNLFKLRTAPLPRNVYEQQTGFVSTYSGITFTYDDSNATTESFPAGFVDPSDPDDQFAAPNPEQWIAFEGKAPVLALTDTCAIHVDEFQDCAPMDSNLFASVTMTDSQGNVLGQTAINDTYPLEMPINVGDTYAFLPNELPTIPSINTPIMITGEHEDDYIRFTLGSLSWTSRTTAGIATCSNGGWDPNDGPVCGQRYGNQNAKNQIQCQVPCSAFS